MARSIATIYTEMVVEKDAQPALNILTSNSVTSIWRLMLYIPAVGMWLHEKLWDAHKEEVEAIKAAAVPLTDEWYKNRALEFQYGDDLEFVHEVPTYPVLDVSKRVVAKAAVVSPDGLIRIKVTGVNSPLDANEEAALEAYFTRLGGAGDDWIIVNALPDLLKITGDVYYNPLVLNTLALREAALESAVNTYLTNLRFNGDFEVLKFEDGLQGADGIKDFDLQYQAKPQGGAYATVTRKYSTTAGYIELDTAAANWKPYV